MRPDGARVFRLFWKKAPKSFNFLDSSQNVDAKPGSSLGPSQNVLSQPAKKLASGPGLGLRPDPSLLGIVTM